MACAPEWMEVKPYSLVQVVVSRGDRAGAFVYRGASEGTWIRFSGSETWPFEEDHVWTIERKWWWPWQNFTATDWVVDLSDVDLVKGLCGYER